MSTTESSSNYNDLERMSIHDLLVSMNNEDITVQLVNAVVGKMKEGGRLFYIGAGTSGRLGILDASEIPPTYGMPHGRVIGLIAGGDAAIRKAVEHAEDSTTQAWEDLKTFDITEQDVLIGIAASGRTPYVVGGVNDAKKNGIVTGCITCNKDSLLASAVDFPIEVIVGPEFVTGSTRMKAGTAQKMILNMISTSTMIQLGKIKGNRMVDMQLSNNKLIDRGTKMIMQELGVDELEASKLLQKYGSVRKAIEATK